jgi:tetraacyldisaccharide 4'-kinase
VGNAIAGGAGKTPSALMLGKILLKNNYKIAYACKNYLSIIESPTKVKPHHSPPQVIEEAILLSKVADTFVAKNIIDAIAMANKYSYDYIITDDGLQNNKFLKNLSILVMDGKIGVGNNMMLPAGPMREPLKKALSKSNIIFMIGEDKHSLSKQLADKKVIKISPKFKLLKAKKTGKHYLAFTGIAYPQKFFNSLEASNIEIKNKIEFPDHHLYSEKDIAVLLEKEKSTNSRLITTEKDLVKIPKKYHKDISYLEIELIPDNKSLLLNILKNI